jgi:uncharacterized phiE125 gp8 family phage protein
VAVLKLATAPAAEPLSLTEAKLHLKVDISTDDDLITSLIKAAREACENFTGRSLITTAWELYFDVFPSRNLGLIELPKCPALAVSAVSYTDADGVTQTVSSALYQLDIVSEPARLLPVDGNAWPTDVKPYKVNAVKVAFTAGYGSAGSSVPESIRTAMRLLLGLLYENREAVNIGNLVTELPIGVQNLLWPYRVMTFPC